MRTTDLNQPLTAKALNENLFKQYNVKINFDKYTREQLEDARNKYRSNVFQTEAGANFNDLLSNESYQKDKFILSVLNTKIKEMLGESIALAERKLSKAEGKKKEEIAKAIGKKDPKMDKSKKIAIATAKAKKVAEVKKPDDDNNGVPNWADKKPGKDDAGNKTTGKKSMSAKQQKFFGKKKAVKESKSELLHKAYQAFIAEGIAGYIAEDEEGKAKSITAAADMVNDFTSWMQRVGNYQTKSMIELADNIRANFGMQEAETFKASVGTALEGALTALTQSREEINNAVAVLAGEAPAEEPMGMDGDMTPDMEAPDEFGGFEEAPSDELNAGDEFAASDAATGAPNELNRMKRESIERGNRLMKILGS